VDDEESSSTSCRRSSRAAATGSCWRATPPEAERSLASEPVDVVLLDLFLPGTSGLELLYAMRSGHRSSR